MDFPSDFKDIEGEQLYYELLFIANEIKTLLHLSCWLLSLQKNNALDSVKQDNLLGLIVLLEM